MKRIALAEGYAWVWMVESDTVPPVDGLSKLLETARRTGAEIVTGIYVLRHGAHVPNLFSVSGGINLGSGMSWDEVRAVKTNEFEVSGGCMGCVLIHPSALDFNFRLDSKAAPDMEWMRHNSRQGRKTLARLDVKCGHIESDGQILRVEDYLK